MPDSNKDWNYPGISKINDGESRHVKLPVSIVGDDRMFTPGIPVYWSYERTIGITVISDQRLERADDYVRVNNSDLSDKSNSYRLTVPAQFFDDYEGRGQPKGASPVPERARFEPGERVHFMHTDEMREGVFPREDKERGITRSCYVYSDDEFLERFSDDQIGDAPRFL